MNKRNGLIAGAVIAVVAIFIGGYELGARTVESAEPPAAATTPQPVKADKPVRAHAQLYIDNHLGFQMEVPFEWVNRYAPIQSGSSVGFAFEKATSPPGTTKMDLVQIFTITRYPAVNFNEAACGCKEIGRNKNAVFGYKFDGQNVALAQPLTVANIQAAMQNTIPEFFKTLD
ncbi:MAG TPA: hypothetical protein VF272_00840 [Candidatus Saccharimonadia bacterium]